MDLFPEGFVPNPDIAPDVQAQYEASYRKYIELELTVEHVELGVHLRDTLGSINNLYAPAKNGGAGPDKVAWAELNNKLYPLWEAYAVHVSGMRLSPDFKFTVDDANRVGIGWALGCLPNPVERQRLAYERRDARTVAFAAKGPR
jgi:hypothetical protein